VAGDTPLLTQRGTLAARDVVIGDQIAGAEVGQMCSVIAATKVSPNGTVLGSFTGDHYVIVKTADGSSNVVVPFSNTTSNSTQQRMVDLVNIATSCASVQTADGAVFTPLSTVFCPSLTWDQYVPLYAGILRMVARTGAFWFDPSSAFQAAYSRLGGRNATFDEGDGAPEAWQSGLPDICELMVACASSGDSCDDLEVVAARWIVKHVTDPNLKSVQESYPNLGNPSATSGTFSADIRGSKQSFPMLATIGAAVGGFVLIAVAVVVVRAARRRALFQHKAFSDRESQSAVISTV